MRIKYRKKPVVIEAIEWTGKNLKEIYGVFLILYNKNGEIYV